MRRLASFLAALLFASAAHAQSLPSPIFGGVNLTSGGSYKINGATALDLSGGKPRLPSLVFESPATVSATTFKLLHTNPTNPVAVSAAQELDHMRVSQGDGSVNQYTIGAGSIVSGLNFQMQANSGSDASSNMYGVIGDVVNAGPGTSKAIYGRATCTGSGATCAGLVSGITTFSGTNISYGVQVSLDSYTNASAVPISAGVNIGSNVGGNTSALNYGLLLSNDVAVQSGGSGFQMSAKGSGDFVRLLNSGASAYLFQVASTGATGIGQSAGALGFAETLSVKGFAALGTSATGIIGDAGNGNFIVGSQSNNPLELRSNGSPIAYVTTSGLAMNVGGLRLTKVAVADLPTCNSGAEGTLYAVTDAGSATFNAALSGGGTNHVMAYCNGSGWTVH